MLGIIYIDSLLPSLSVRGIVLGSHVPLTVCNCRPRHTYTSPLAIFAIISIEHAEVRVFVFFSTSIKIQTGVFPGLFLVLSANRASKVLTDNAVILLASSG